MNALLFKEYVWILQYLTSAYNINSILEWNIKMQIFNKLSLKFLLHDIAPAKKVISCND